MSSKETHIRLSDLIYNDYFKKEDFKSDFISKYQEQIRVYEKIVSKRFAKKLLKELIKEYFKRKENILIDFRVASVRKYYDELCLAIWSNDDVKNEDETRNDNQEQ